MAAPATPAPGPGWSGQEDPGGQEGGGGRVSQDGGESLWIFLYYTKIGELLHKGQH